MSLRFFLRLGVVIVPSLFAGWLLGSSIGYAIAKPPQAKRARSAAQPLANFGAKEVPGPDQQQLRPTTHASLRLSSSQPAHGQFILDASVIIKDPHPVDIQLPAALAYGVFATVTDLDGNIIVDEKIGNFIDRPGAGNFSQNYRVTYNMQPGVYLVRVSVHNPLKPYVAPDGTITPGYLCMSQRRMIVE